MASSSLDIVGTWDVSLPSGNHRVVFEHGTTTGKRVILVDGNEVLRHNWMFKLVGKVEFYIETKKACIVIEAVTGFAYEYTLHIDGKPLKKFRENRRRLAKVWTLCLDDVDTRIVLEKDTMDVWSNGAILETAGEFIEGGSETHFRIGKHECCIKSVSSGKRREGIIQSLIIDDLMVPEAVE